MKCLSTPPTGPFTSIGKLYFCPVVEDLADFQISLVPLADQFELYADAPARATGCVWPIRRGTEIAGGSTYIQPNIVAERILGMPRS